jgi:hypothetical protein
MKLALVVNRSIVSIGALDRAVAPRARAATNALPRQSSIQPRKAWRPSGALVAHWHVSPETGRAECRWSLEEPPADDYLSPGSASAIGRRRAPSGRRYGTGLAINHGPRRRIVVDRVRSDCRG